MNNKVNLTEETNRMRNLFGYKAGKVISEQEINSSKYLNEEDNDNDPSNDADYLYTPVGKPEIAIPNGVSQAAVDKILAFSKENKSKYKGSYLFPPQRNAIDGEFGAGTYNRFFYGGGEDVLKGDKIFKAVVDDVTNTREQNLLAIYKLVDKDGIIRAPGSQMNGVKWEDYVKTYKVTNDEISKLKGNPNVVLPKPAAVKQVVNPPIPKELVDINGVKKFQEWLNTQDPTWVNGKTLELDPKRGYGRFGPLTTASWNKLKDVYLKEIGSLQANQKVIANPELAPKAVASTKGAQITAPIKPVG